MPRKNRKNRRSEPKPSARPAARAAHAEPAAKPAGTAGPRAEATAAPVLREGVKVSAVRVHRGPPATTIHVEVDREKVRASVGDDEVEEVLARLPAHDGDSEALRWHDERLDRDASAPGAASRYSATHYGPTEAARYGVGVVIRTKKGSVEARPASDVRETDKPEGAHPEPPADLPS